MHSTIWLHRQLKGQRVKKKSSHILTYFMLCGVARDDHGHDFQSLGAAAQAVDVGDVGTLVIH